MAGTKLLAWPYRPMWRNDASFTNFTLDASTDALEFIFQAKEAATITRLGVRLGAITGTTPTYRISLQGVGSTGNPDGTIKGATNNALKTFSPSGLGWAAGSWNWLTLDETAAVTRGQQLAVVVDYSSGTVDGSNNASFTSVLANAPEQLWNHPYSITNNAGSRTKGGSQWVFGYGSATTAYGFPAETITNASINSGSSPSEVAMKFTLPAGIGDTFKIVGVEFGVQPAAAADFDIILYQGGDAGDVTVLQNKSFDGDIYLPGSRSVFSGFFDEADLTALTFGNTYRLAVKPTTANSIHFQYLDTDAAADLDAWPGGSECSFSSRAGGNWTDVATRRVPMRLLLDDITAPTRARYLLGI